MEFIFPMKYLAFWLVSAAGVLALAAFALRRLEQRRRRRLHAFADAGLAARLSVGNDARLRRPLSVLPILGFACLALAFAQPHWGQSWQEISKQSRAHAVE